MKIIGINALFLLPNQVGGTEYHLRTTVHGLQMLHSDVQYILFCNAENYDSFDVNVPNWSKVRCPVHATNRVIRLLYEQWVLPFLLIKYHCDCLHSFGYFGPIMTPRVKQIITVHDVNWRDAPQDVSFVQGLILRVCIECNLRTATKIITDSDFSLTRLGYYFPQYLPKISVISPLVALQFSSKPKRQSHTLLCVSGMYPHKRVSYALQIIRELHAKDSRWRGIIIGKNGAEEQQNIQQMKKMSYVRYFPKVNREKLIHWYQTASVFVFPSVYEGFGYPVYEAAAAGMQIFVGNKKLYAHSLQPSLMEITGHVRKDAAQINRMSTLMSSVVHRLPSATLFDISKKLVELYVQQ